MRHATRDALKAAIALCAPTGAMLPIAAGPLRGLYWPVGAMAGKYKGLSVFANNYEYEQLGLLARRIRPESVCIDVGANVGLYSLLFAARSTFCYSVEPEPNNIARLTRTLKFNRIQNCSIITAAAGQDIGIGKFRIGVNNAAGSVSNDGDSIVPIVSIDAMCAAGSIQPSILKVDVEGAELDVLDGARRTLSTTHPEIFLSVHSDALAINCVNFLRQLGYISFVPIDSDSISSAREIHAGVDLG